jgi:hypothetical protein
VVQPDRGGQTPAVLGEAQGSGRETLLEQGDELGTDEGAKNVLPSRNFGARNGRDLGGLAEEGAEGFGDSRSKGAILGKRFCRDQDQSP